MRYTYFILLLLLMFAVWLLSSGISRNSDNQQTVAFEEIMPSSAEVPCISLQDSLIFYGVVDSLKQQGDRSLPALMMLVAHYFEGTPYVAATLEQEGPERLVVNLREMDCTTYAENVLAIARCVRAGQPGLNHFARQLRLIRYRDGVINRYPSRLHYFTDWLVNNQKMGIIEIVSNSLGDAPFDTGVNFMTSHADKYPKLAARPEFVEDMKVIEEQMASYKLRYLTADQIERVADQIKDGDIVAFCTTVEGLDVSHVGIAIHGEEGPGFIHASLTGGRVEVSEQKLSEFVAGSRSIYGILVARAK